MYNLIEDILIIEIHLVINRIINWIMTICLVFYIASVFKLVQFVYLIIAVLNHLLLQGSFQLLTFLTFYFVLLQHLHFQEITVLLEIVSFLLFLFLLLLLGVVYVLKIFLCSIIPKFIGIIKELNRCKIYLLKG